MDKEQEKVVNDLFNALSNPYRRQLLVALLDHNPQDDSDRDPFDILSEADKAEVLELMLVHTHLPKLDHMGYISWNRSAGTISKGPRWNEIAPILKLMHDHRNELPNGWL